MKNILLLSLLLLPFNVSAQVCGQDCIDRPSCAKLGYKQNITCTEGYITCPFDSSYKWCKQYTCEDGRYYSAPLKSSDGYSCIQVEYHDLICYECSIALCEDGYYNRETCWNGLLHELVTDAERCAALGYTDDVGNCREYLKCPASKTKVKCLLR